MQKRRLPTTHVSVAKMWLAGLIGLIACSSARSAPPRAAGPESLHTDDTLRQLFESRSARRARQTAAKVDISAIESAIDQFEVDVGRYPTTEEGFQALLHEPKGVPHWHGPYIKRLPVDPWGSAYVYVSPGVHNTKVIDVSSSGPNRKPGDRDDIDNWSETPSSFEDAAWQDDEQPRPGEAPISELRDALSMLDFETLSADQKSKLRQMLAQFKKEIAEKPESSNAKANALIRAVWAMLPEKQRADLSKAGAAQMGREQEMDRRLSCARNMRQLGMAMQLYTIDHGGKFPTDLAALPISDQMPKYAIEQFLCPSSGLKPPDGSASWTAKKVLEWAKASGDYIYLGAGKSVAIDANTPILLEKLENHAKPDIPALRSGINVLYADGHVEFVTGDAAKRIAAQPAAAPTSK